jgi:hypothetical protein
VIECQTHCRQAIGNLYLGGVAVNADYPSFRLSVLIVTERDAHFFLAPSIG